MLNTNLPLINKSLSQLLDIASDVADKIQAAITSPSDAIQELNNILANAFGMPTPSVAVTENQHGTGGTPEKILIVVDAINGSFRLTFPPNRGPPVTTDSISYNPATPAANATAIQTALNKLAGVDVTVTQFGGGYLVTFNVNGPQSLFFADATKLVKTNLLTYVNGEIDFAFDLGASIQIARPFNLDLSSITDSLPGPLAGIVNTLIGAGGSGNLTVNVGANLHIALGLDLSQPASITAGSLHINATGGTFKVTYNGHATTALAWNVSAGDLQDSASPPPGPRLRNGQRRPRHVRGHRRHAVALQRRRHVAHGQPAELLPQDRLGRRRHAPRPDRERRRHQPQLQRAPRPLRPLHQGRQRDARRHHPPELPRRPARRPFQPRRLRRRRRLERPRLDRRLHRRRQRLRQPARPGPLRQHVPDRARRPAALRRHVSSFQIPINDPIPRGARPRTRTT